MRFQAAANLIGELSLPEVNSLKLYDITAETANSSDPRFQNEHISINAVFPNAVQLDPFDSVESACRNRSGICQNVIRTSPYSPLYLRRMKLAHRITTASSASGASLTVGALSSPKFRDEKGDAGGRTSICSTSEASQPAVNKDDTDSSEPLNLVDAIDRKLGFYGQQQQRLRSSRADSVAAWAAPDGSHSVMILPPDKQSVIKRMSLSPISSIDPIYRHLDMPLDGERKMMTKGGTGLRRHNLLSKQLTNGNGWAFFAQIGFSADWRDVIETWGFTNAFDTLLSNVTFQATPAGFQGDKGFTISADGEYAFLWCTGHPTLQVERKTGRKVAESKRAGLISRVLRLQRYCDVGSGVDVKRYRDTMRHLTVSSDGKPKTGPPPLQNTIGIRDCKESHVQNILGLDTSKVRDSDELWKLPEDVEQFKPTAWLEISLSWPKGQDELSGRGDYFIGYSQSSDVEQALQMLLLAGEAKVLDGEKNIGQIIAYCGILHLVSNGCGDLLPTFSKFDFCILKLRKQHVASTPTSHKSTIYGFITDSSVWEFVRVDNFGSVVTSGPIVKAPEVLTWLAYLLTSARSSIPTASPDISLEGLSNFAYRVERFTVGTDDWMKMEEEVVDDEEEYRAFEKAFEENKTLASKKP
ncbi:hypothetical protein HK097_001233 [Rhizophlyctis rosea]|uniref:Uncharacterized protein n=1 Tax=Rhizophlyctis rosea TaxID=64517 RepID=A0AAD5S7F8_9FUNG|nr:hypothetical protein HK097_001233 [Rhizophlyctis rosea]